MELGDVYSKLVTKKSISLSNLSNGFSSPQIERDSQLIKLENQVFNKIKDLVKEEQPQKNPPQNELKTLSVEDAIRELKELGEI